MCHTAVGLISTALHEVDNAESLLKTKNLIALFMQTMNVGTFATIGRLLLTPNHRLGTLRWELSKTYSLPYSKNMLNCLKNGSVTIFKR